MAFLYLSRQVIEDREEQLRAIAEESARRTSYVPPLSPVEVLTNSVHALIANGDSEGARVSAKRLATLVYDNQLDRNICEETGNAYFHACEDW